MFPLPSIIFRMMIPSYLLILQNLWYRLETTQMYALSICYNNFILRNARIANVVCLICNILLSSFVVFVSWQKDKLKYQNDEVIKITKAFREKEALKAFLIQSWINLLNIQFSCYKSISTEWLHSPVIIPICMACMWLFHDPNRNMDP